MARHRPRFSLDPRRSWAEGASAPTSETRPAHAHCPWTRPGSRLHVHRTSSRSPRGAPSAPTGPVVSGHDHFGGAAGLGHHGARQAEAPAAHQASALDGQTAFGSEAVKEGN